LRLTKSGDAAVQLQVTDNGEGIAPENLIRIFSHGFTTREDGHGFGLHSCALATKGMGGILTAHSEGAGRGATFTLRLPIRATVPAEAL
jgi:signal transduction histidine kinase